MSVHSAKAAATADKKPVSIDKKSVSTNNRVGEKPSVGARVPKPASEASDVASKLAKQRAAVILEVLAGLRSPLDAAAALQVSLPRFYLLEQQALRGLVQGCEPKILGPHPSPQKKIVRLEQQIGRLESECARQQALVRAAQRTVGLSPPPQPSKSPPKGGGKRRRKRKPTVRALKAVAQLHSQLAETAEPATAPSTAANASPLTPSPAV